MRFPVHPERVGLSVWVPYIFRLPLHTAASDSDPVYHDYAEKYVALLKANGFVEKEYPLASYGQGVQLYKDGLYVRIPNSSADTLMSGIRFLIEIEK